MYHKKTPTDLSAIKFLRGVMQRSLGSQCCHMFRSGAVQKNLEKKTQKYYTAGCLLGFLFIQCDYYDSIYQHHRLHRYVIPFSS